MTAIDDATLISRITLPGTHDTAALHGGPTAECQVRSPLQQLQIGIRLLDVRLCYFQSKAGGLNFSLHHGGTYQWAYFDQTSDYSDNPDCREFVLQDCISFLTDNPTECIVMCIKQENSDVDTSTFMALFNAIAGKDSFKNFFYLGSAVPGLGDVRGKIVVVNRVAEGTGIFWGSWDKQLLVEDSGSRNLDVEDHYAEAFAANKWDYVRDHLNKAAAAPAAAATWYVTYASCAGPPAPSVLPNPQYYADVINPELAAYFTTASWGNLPGMCYGSVYMDFPSPALTGQVIQIAQAAYPAAVPATVKTATTPWLFDEYDGSIEVSHDYGQNNRIALQSTADVGKIEVLYQGGYGIINLRAWDLQNNVIPPDTGYSDSKHGSGWVASDFDGESCMASGDIDGIQFAYQGGYGIVNIRVHLKGQGAIWENWLTEVKPSSFNYVTDAFAAGGGVHWIGTWRQDKHGIVDAQCCYTL